MPETFSMFTGAVAQPAAMPIAAAAGATPISMFVPQTPTISTSSSVPDVSNPYPTFAAPTVPLDPAASTIAAGDFSAQSEGSPNYSGEEGSDGEVPQDSDDRFKWEEATMPWEASDELKQLDMAQAIDGWGPMDDRAFQADVLRAGADTIQQIGQFRVIAYYQGKINTQKQIFPVLRDTSTNTYKRMIINALSAGYSERSQIIKSNKALHAYFFNDAPEVITIQGQLKTNAFDPWDMAMLLAWDRLLRGTELARHNAILELSIADMVYWVYPLSFQYQTQAASQFVASFSMQLLVIDKLIPLANLNNDVLELVTDEEEFRGFVTTNVMASNDIAGTAIVGLDLPSAKQLRNLPTDEAAALDRAEIDLSPDSTRHFADEDFLSSPGVPVALSPRPATELSATSAAQSITTAGCAP